MRVRALLVPVVMMAALAVGACTTPAPAPTQSATPTPTDNGVSALAADEILNRSKAALNAATSYHAKTAGDGGLAFDLVYKGADVKGTYKIVAATVELVRVGADLYLKGDENLWKSFVPADKQAIVLPLVSGKYVKLDATNKAKIEALVPTPAQLMDFTAPLTKDAASTVNGVPAIGVKDADGAILYVATTGEPYPVQMKSTELTVDVSEFNAPVTIAAPAASEVFDLAAAIG